MKNLYPVKVLSVLISVLLGITLGFQTNDVRAQSAIPLCEITRTLAKGAIGEDVRCLQRYLNFAGFTLNAYGPGSPGNETIYFGPLTQNAVIRWQENYRADVLAPLGLTQGTGVWGIRSFSKYVSLVRIALGLNR